MVSLAAGSSFLEAKSFAVQQCLCQSLSVGLPGIVAIANLQAERRAIYMCVTATTFASCTSCCTAW